MNAIIQSNSEPENIHCNFLFRGSHLHTRTMRGIAPPFIKASTMAPCSVLPSLCGHFTQREAPSPREIDRTENRAISSCVFRAPRGSLTNRTARSRSSGEYLFECSMHPVSQGLEPPENQVRFTSSVYCCASCWTQSQVWARPCPGTVLFGSPACRLVAGSDSLRA